MTTPTNDPPNLDRLIKLLKLSASPIDGEALMAIRAANAALTKFGGDWEALLRGRVTIIADPFQGNIAPPKVQPTPNPTAPPRPMPHPAPPWVNSQPAPPPRQAPPPPRAPQPAVNMFEGRCVACGGIVAAQAGLRTLGPVTRRGNSSKRRWEVQHKPGMCQVAKPNTKPAKPVLGDILNQF